MESLRGFRAAEAAAAATAAGLNPNNPKSFFAQVAAGGADAEILTFPVDFRNYTGIQTTTGWVFMADMSALDGADPLQ